MENKPDGWVAWHPNDGIKDIALSKGSCQERFTCIRQEYHKTFEEYIAVKEGEVAFAESNGWRFRPVKLVFLDKEPTK